MDVSGSDRDALTVIVQDILAMRVFVDRSAGLVNEMAVANK
jgi:hypothetical protein